MKNDNLTQEEEQELKKKIQESKGIESFKTLFYDEKTTTVKSVRIENDDNFKGIRKK